MKVLLINANSASDAASGPQVLVPYGVLYLASALERNGDAVRIVDRNADPEGIEDIISEFEPSLVGVSVMTGPCILDALQVSRLAKRINPDIQVVWGGVHPTMFPEMCLSEPSVDLVVRKEGDYAIVDIVNGLSTGSDPSKIEGISYKKDDKIYHTPERPLIQDLDALPYPAWHLLDISKYTHNRLDGRKYLSMNTSRGCPYRCTFCYNKMFNKRKWRGLSAEKIIEQIHYLISEYGIGFVEFLEDNFTVNHRRLEKLCDCLIEDNLDLKWYCESRVGSLGRKLLTKMKRAGCVGIGFGVESGSPRILEFIKKDITVEQTIQTFELCREIGICPDAYAMVGLPHETVDDFKMTMKLLDRIPYKMCDLMVFRPYPGTELYELCLSEGLFNPPNDLESWAEISDLHSPRYSIGQIPENLIRSAKRKTQLQSRYHDAKKVLKETPFLTLLSKLPYLIRVAIEYMR